MHIHLLQPELPHKKLVQQHVNRESIDLQGYSHSADGTYVFNVAKVLGLHTRFTESE